MFQIRDNKIKFLIHTNIYHCKVSFFMSHIGTLIQRSNTPLGKQSLLAHRMYRGQNIFGFVLF
jgi:hypothetical protein